MKRLYSAYLWPSEVNSITARPPPAYMHIHLLAAPKPKNRPAMARGFNVAFRPSSKKFMQ